MKIAIYGGSFDPPHLGHEKIVEKALKNLDIDSLFIIPTWQNPFKENFFAPPKLRLKWIKTLWEDKKKVKICEFELNNFRPTSTYESVSYLYKKYDIKKCYLIIGADNLQNLEKWANYELLKQKVEFVIASRDDLHVNKNLKKLKINVNISSSKLRNTLQEKFIPTKIFKSVSKFYKGKKCKRDCKKL